MEGALHRFVRLLRLHGVRSASPRPSTPCTRRPARRARRPRDAALRAAGHAGQGPARPRASSTASSTGSSGCGRWSADEEQGHWHAHDDLSDEGELEQFTLSDKPGDTPEQGHSPRQARRHEGLLRPGGHGPAVQPAPGGQQPRHGGDDRRDRAVQRPAVGHASRPAACSCHQPAAQPRQPGRARERPRARARHRAHRGRRRWRCWAGSTDNLARRRGADEPENARRAAASAGAAARGPARAAAATTWRSCSAPSREIEAREVDGGHARRRLDEHERAELEESLRRLLRSLHGAPRPRRAIAARGVVDGAPHDAGEHAATTACRSGRSPSRRSRTGPGCWCSATSRCRCARPPGSRCTSCTACSRWPSQVRTLRLRRRTCVEITDLFAEHRIEDALSLVLAGLPAGGVLDVDADSDYGTAFEQFLEQYGSARRPAVRPCWSSATGAATASDPRHAGVRGADPAGPRDGVADPGAEVLLGPGALRPAGATRSTATACRWCATCTGSRRSPRRCRGAGR